MIWYGLLIRAQGYREQTDERKSLSDKAYALCEIITTLDGPFILRSSSSAMLKVVFATRGSLICCMFFVIPWQLLIYLHPVQAAEVCGDPSMAF